MKLKKLLKDIPVKEIKGPSEIEVTGICSNSKLVSPGNLFIARKGKTFDGEKYIPEAITAGAIAVLTDFGNPFLKKYHPNYPFRYFVYRTITCCKLLSNA